mgnify:CR=1 FL=1
MKKLPLLLLLITLSSNIQAEIGDMYICTMGEYNYNNRPGGMKKRGLESFIFERGGDYIEIFSEGTYDFRGGRFNVYDSKENGNFKAEGWQILISYDSELFSYVKLHDIGMTNVQALCYIRK